MAVLDIIGNEVTKERFEKVLNFMVEYVDMTEDQKGFWTFDPDKAEIEVVFKGIFAFAITWRFGQTKMGDIF